MRKGVASAEKSVQKAIESFTKVQADLESAEAFAEEVDTEELQSEATNKVKRLKAQAEKLKEEESSAQESLEAKDALLSRALQENEALLFVLYKNFTDVLMKHLLDDLIEKPIDGPEPDQGDSMTVDKEPSAMDADDDDERRNQRFAKSNGLHAEEQEWCRVTLGQIRALTRQYAAEIWPHIEKLDAEVFTGDVHPSIVRAVYDGLRRPFSQFEGDSLMEKI